MDIERALRTALRTAHLLAFGSLYGGQIFGVEPERLTPALAATVGTGAALLLADAVRTPVAFVQIRGLAAFTKLALVAAVVTFWNLATLLLTVAAVIGAVSSHMPGRYRYYSVFHGRVIGSQHKG